MSSEISEVMKYFSSPMHFIPLKLKAAEALKSPPWSGYSAEERKLLQEIVSMNIQIERDLEIRERIITLGAYKIDKLVRKLMDPFSEPSEKKGGPLSRPGISKGALHLESLPKFARLASKALHLKSCWLPFEVEILNTIIRADKRVESGEDFHHVIENLLGMHSLKQIIPDSALEEGKNPIIVRERILRSILDRLLKEESPTRGGSLELKIEEPILLSVVEQKKGGLHKKSKSAYCGSFPPNSLSILNPEIRWRAIEGAVCMQFLFTGFFKKHFKTDLEREIIESLYHLHYLLKGRYFLPEDSIKMAFGGILPGKEGEVDAVLKKLTDQQSLKNVMKMEKIQEQREVPPCFLNYPFNQPQHLKEFLEQVSEIKYRYKSLFKTLGKSEIKLIDFLLKVNLVVDYLKFPFLKAVGLMLAHYPKTSFKKIDKLNQLTKLSIEENSEMDEESFSQELDTNLCLKERIVFEFSMSVVDEKEYKIEEKTTREVLKLLRIVKDRMERDGIGFQKAKREALNRGSIGNIFQSGTKKNLLQFKQALSHLTPSLFADEKRVAHNSMKNEIEFRRLMEIVTKVRSEDEQTQKVIDSLKATPDELNLDWSLLKWLKFNEVALQHLFGKKNPLENIQELNRQLDKIIKLPFSAPPL